MLSYFEDIKNNKIKSFIYEIEKESIQENYFNGLKTILSDSAQDLLNKKVITKRKYTEIKNNIEDYAYFTAVLRHNYISKNNRAMSKYNYEKRKFIENKKNLIYNKKKPQ